MFKETQSLKRNQFICFKQYSLNKTVSPSFEFIIALAMGVTT